MALVICDMSISLDGYVTGPNDSRAYKRPQRCCAAWLVTPSRAAISAHEYPAFRSRWRPEAGFGRRPPGS